LTAGSAARRDHLRHRPPGGRRAALFLQSLADGDFSAVELTTSDYAWMAEFVATYGDLPLGTTDASVIAIAERLKLTEVAALDRRHSAHCAPPEHDFSVDLIVTPDEVIECEPERRPTGLYWNNLTAARHA
jgi:hypothetical protein